MQEAALKAWRKFAGFREGAEMRPWFLTIVANQCRTVRRGRWSSIIKLANLPNSAHVPEERIVLGVDLRRALRRLNHRDRMVIILHFYLDLPFKEVAAIAGGSVEAVKSQIYRAVRRLEPNLESGE